MTRARRRLVLSWADRYEGGRAWRPSRFLDELGGDVVERDLRAEPSALSPPPRPGPPPPPARARATSPARGEGPLVLSFSGISVYRECPRQHWYRYRLRLPAAPVV